ncbi:hypothetical protein VTK73DRAFT_1836 [Phialemonium thermophilum]|uniref:Uncharacterized protein n=1 Tax=Phialemonium thermophilum TaxID=223376 RepID=A0ABR3X7F9_9PEZI
MVTCQATLHRHGVGIRSVPSTAGAAKAALRFLRLSFQSDYLDTAWDISTPTNPRAGTDTPRTTPPPPIVRGISVKSLLLSVIHARATAAPLTPSIVRFVAANPELMIWTATDPSALTKAVGRSPSLLFPAEMSTRTALGLIIRLYWANAQNRLDTS